MELRTLALVGQLATTLPLVGLIWLIQVVAYPLFARVARADFPAYHQAHSRLVTYLVAPLMVGELAFAALWILEPLDTSLSGTAWVGGALAALTWVVTMLVSVPQHAKLARGFDARAHAVLVATNWIRTALWTARGAILVWVVANSAALLHPRGG